MLLVCVCCMLHVTVLMLCLSGDAGSDNTSPASSNTHSPVERPPRPIGGERGSHSHKQQQDAGFHNADMAGLWNFNRNQGSQLACVVVA